MKEKNEVQNKKNITKNLKHGFTLIEILVVVLIIGILAAIALPQYNKAVEKTRLAEALLTVNSLQKSIDVYLLTKGFPSSSQVVCFLSDDPDVALDADVVQSLECNRYGCSSKFFSYQLQCNQFECTIGVFRKIDVGNGDYAYQLYINKREEKWEKLCQYTEDYEYICNELEQQGFERESC